LVPARLKSPSDNTLNRHILGEAQIERSIWSCRFPLDGSEEYPAASPPTIDTNATPENDIATMMVAMKLLMMILERFGFYA
jgi:hypothetical protein